MTQKNVAEKTSVERLDYDNLFKTVLRRYFWDGLEIFCPSLFADADTLRKPGFFEQELEKAVYDLDKGAVRTDLLVRVPLKSGNEQWILCHLELQQGAGGGNLPIRMYKYKSLIFLKYDVEPVAIAVHTSPRSDREARSYSVERYGTKSVYEYNNIDIRELDDARLLAGENRVALVLYAAKRARESRNDEGRKFRYLRDISNIWAERGWPDEDKRLIMLSIEYLINLRDPDYSKQLVEHFESLVREGKIVYTTLMERAYIEKAQEEGLEKGKLEVAGNMLKRGFSIEQIAEATNLPRTKIESIS